MVPNPLELVLFLAVSEFFSPPKSWCARHRFIIIENNAIMRELSKICWRSKHRIAQIWTWSNLKSKARRKNEKRKSIDFGQTCALAKMYGPLDRTRISNTKKKDGEFNDFCSLYFVTVYINIWSIHFVPTTHWPKTKLK